MTSYQQPGIYIQGPWTPPSQQPQPPAAVPPPPAPPAPPQPVVQPGGTIESRREGFAHHHARRCGTVQIACAISVLLTAGLLILTKGYLYIVGAGFWGGALFLIAGSLGVHSSIKKENKHIIATMIFSILSCLAACVGAAFGCLAFHQDYRYLVYCWPEDEDAERARPYFCIYELQSSRFFIFISLGCHVVNMLFNVIEALTALVQSGVCCRAVCCGGRNSDNVVVYVPYTDAHHEQGALLQRNQGDTFAQASAPPMDPPPYSETPEHRLYPALQ